MKTVKTVFSSEINELPKKQLQVGNASINITPKGDIHLKTARAELILTAAGEIIINGKNIYLNGTD